MLTQAHKGELLTVAETPARLGLHPMTVRKKIERGEIPALRLGGKGSAIRVDERELEQWLYADDSGGYSFCPNDPAERRAPDSSPALEARQPAGRTQRTR
jgi:excisionase family DNA binding protein